MGFFCVQYDLSTPNIQNKCDNFSQSFFLHHIIRYSHIVLIITHHNKVREELLYISQENSPSKYVRGKALIHKVGSRSDEEVRQGGRGLDAIGGVLIQVVW